MRTGRLALAVFAVMLTGPSYGCARTSAGQDNPPKLQFSNSTRRPETAPVTNYREAYENANGFAATWVDKDLPVATWRARLAALATADFKAVIGSATFPAASSVTGDIAPRASRPDRIEFTAPTDDGVLIIVTVPEDSHWHVSEIAGPYRLMPAPSPRSGPVGRTLGR